MIFTVHDVNAALYNNWHGNTSHLIYTAHTIIYTSLFCTLFLSMQLLVNLCHTEKESYLTLFRHCFETV